MKTKKNNLVRQCVLIALVLTGVLVVFNACRKTEDLETATSRVIVGSIVINTTDTLPVLIGTDTLLNLSVSPADASNMELVWASRNEAVATVDAKGRVKVLTAGETYIVVKATDGGERIDSILVRGISTVKLVAGLELTASATSVYQGETLTLKAVITPVDATYKTLKWESSNPAVATVSQTGLVNALAKGNVDFTVSTTDGSKISKKVSLVVNEVINATSIQITALSETLGIGETAALNITTIPANATTAALTWSTSDAKIVTVTKTGVVTAVAAGEAIIIVQNTAGVKGTTTIKVEEGKINDFFTSISSWAAVTSGSTGLLSNNRFKVTMALQSSGKYRGDFQRSGGVTLHAGTYPIIAFKFNTPLSDAGNIVFDTSNGSYLNGNNKMTTLTGADGVTVRYADLSTGTFGASAVKLSTTASTKLAVFQLKVADFVVNSTQLAQGGNTYEVYWVKSFRSLDELKAYIAK